MSTKNLSVSVTPGKENRYFDLRVPKNSFLTDAGAPVRPEVLYESIRNALLNTDLGFEMIMIRVGKNPAYRSMPHFALHVPSQKRIYYDPLQAFRSSVTEINRRGSLRLWSFRSEAEFWETQYTKFNKAKEADAEATPDLSEDNLPDEVLDKVTISAAPAETDLGNDPGLQMPDEADEPTTAPARSGSLLSQLNQKLVNADDLEPVSIGDVDVGVVYQNSEAVEAVEAASAPEPHVGTDSHNIVVDIDDDNESDGQADTLAK